MSNKTSDRSLKLDGEHPSIVSTVDARRLSCPLPLLKAKQALHPLADGDCLKVLATDKGSVRDFHAYCDLSDHLLLKFTEKDDYYEYILQKMEPLNK